MAIKHAGSVLLSLTYEESMILESLLYSVESDEPKITDAIAAMHNALAGDAEWVYRCADKIVRPADGGSLNVVAGEDMDEVLW
ncbi:MAG TPA: hypothetical protein PLQ54_02560 [Armatimonadota bacterium]|nr:hypothetical protein [Armatimonadota bacterium]